MSTKFVDIFRKEWLKTAGVLLIFTVVPYGTETPQVPGVATAGS